MSEVTRILERLRNGDASASEQLLHEVHSELRRMASEKLARERAGHTLQATALVHEAYLRLVGSEPAPQWHSPAHFFGAAAEAMRRILIEAARRKRRLRHGGGQRRVDLDSACMVLPSPSVDLLALDAALERFGA